MAVSITLQANVAQTEVNFIIADEMSCTNEVLHQYSNIFS